MTTSSTSKVTSSAPQNVTTHIATGVLTNLCQGQYNIIIFTSYNKTSIDYNHIISQTTVNVISTHCRTMTSSSSLYSSQSVHPSVAGKYISLQNNRIMITGFCRYQPKI